MKVSIYNRQYNANGGRNGFNFYKHIKTVSLAEFLHSATNEQYHCVLHDENHTPKFTEKKYGYDEELIENDKQMFISKPKKTHVYDTWEKIEASISFIKEK